MGLPLSELERDIWELVEQLRTIQPTSNSEVELIKVISKLVMIVARIGTELVEDS